MAKYATVPPEIETMPKGIPYIIGNEAAERFSFYGMRAILAVFLAQYLHLMSSNVQSAMTDAEASEHYHTFVSWVYLFPIAGALISDAFTGKYRIIMAVSFLYCIGHLSLALMGTQGISAQTWMWAGLLLIAMGAGGIKPCVSAHVGDQFGTKNKHLLEKVYQWFYFSINFGSAISTILTPWLLEWYGPHVAFGVPGILMAIATVSFWLGRKVFVHIPPAGTSFLKEVFSKEGITTILKLLLVYASILVFWALFDQTSSVWVLQAEDMDRRWMGIEWLSSQFQVVNPILVMLMIPLFQFVIYPAINKVFKLTPLRKISIGLFVAAFAFGLSAVAQGWIDDGARPSIGWQVLAYVIITGAEVMVSITGLEFSYTQAPKAMKSVIMSVWFFSVSMGNIVTAMVNHYIQVPGIAAVASAAPEFEDTTAEPATLDNRWEVRLEREFVSDEEPKLLRVSGPDGEFETPDDVTLTFDQYDNLLKVFTVENEVLISAKELIDEAFIASHADDRQKQLPDDEAGMSLIAGLKDSHGNALTYDKITGEQYRIISNGPEGEMFTPWNVVMSATVSRPDPEAAERNRDKPLTWRERRIIELMGERGRKEVQEGRGETPTLRIGESFSVGGLVTLEGADYYWFWTWFMVGGAVLFVPIACLYRGKTYIQGAEKPIEEPA